VADGSRKVRRACSPNQANRQVPERCHDLGTRSLADLRTTLIKRHVPYPVEPVLGPPVATVQTEQPGHRPPASAGAANSSHLRRHRPRLSRSSQHPAGKRRCRIQHSAESSHRAPAGGRRARRRHRSRVRHPERPDDGRLRSEVRDAGEDRRCRGERSARRRRLLDPLGDRRELHGGPGRPGKRRGARVPGGHDLPLRSGGGLRGVVRGPSGGRGDPAPSPRHESADAHRSDRRLDHRRVAGSGVRELPLRPRASPGGVERGARAASHRGPDAPCAGYGPRPHTGWRRDREAGGRSVRGEHRARPTGGADPARRRGDAGRRDREPGPDHGRVCAGREVLRRRGLRGDHRRGWGDRVPRDEAGPRHDSRADHLVQEAQSRRAPAEQWVERIPRA